MDLLLQEFLHTSVKYVRGVGPGRAKVFERLRIRTIKDLIFYFPYNYIDRRKTYRVAQAPVGTVVNLIVTVKECVKPHSRKAPYKFVCYDETGELEVLYFNYSNYIKNLFPIGEKVLISGKVEGHLILQMLHPEIVTSPSKLEQIAIIEPVYHTVRGLTSKAIAQVVREVLSKDISVSEWLPQEVIKENEFPSFMEAIKATHFPYGPDYLSMIEKANQRLALDEIIAQQISLANFRDSTVVARKEELNFKGDYFAKVKEYLPFSLTESQNKVIEEITANQRSDKHMVRLVQGDVGSGKTMVGLAAMLNAIEAGKQAALMAPTEILARQHFATIEPLMRKLDIKCALLTRTLSSQEKSQSKANIAQGDAKLIIGTHALFQEGIVFKDLSLIVVDEQHRFGVEQRVSILKKANNPDLLMMTATPIPRTLSMILYGDMDVSTVREKPAQRGKIETSVISSSKLDELIAKVVDLAKRGKKIYWLCPLIEESEKLSLTDVTQRYETLNDFLPGKVALVHGRIKAQERDEYMQAFKESKFSILVATTVIEVGVDVPDATIMVIENAERFGLSQLHQLRGRVGRGTEDSYCLLLYKQPISKVSYKRLMVVKNSNDGFEIAEKDLELRGSGELLGTKQSGLPNFKAFQFGRHEHLLSLAKGLSQKFSKTEYLQHRPIKQLLTLYSQEESAENTIKW